MAKESPAPAKSHTNWKAFAEARMVPKEMRCEGYQEYHRVNSGCHTRLVPDVANVIAHIDHGHGGGFIFHLKQTEGKPWRGWEDMAAAGLECHNLICGLCFAQIPFHPQYIIKHRKPHLDANKRIRKGGEFRMTILPVPALPPEEEAFQSYGEEPEDE